jgi:hypothetical protein
VDAIHELLVTAAGVEKLGGHGVSSDEARELLGNKHLTARNPSGPPGRNRRLLIGRTDGGRVVTLVLEPTIEPTTWLIVTGWESTASERNLLTR